MRIDGLTQGATTLRLLVKHEARSLLSFKSLIVAVLTGLAPALVYGWLASKLQFQEARLHLAYGAPIFAVWTGYLFRVSYLIFIEDMLGTLNTIRLSGSSLFLVASSKCWGLLLGSLPRGIIAAVITLTMVGGQLGLTNPTLWISILVVLASLHAFALLLSPLRVYVAVREGALNSLIPATAILSAILFPAERMPNILYWVSSMFPIRWAMEALSSAATGAVDSFALAMAIGLLFVYNILAIIIYGKVEERLANE